MLIQSLNWLKTQKSHPKPQQHPAQATQQWVLVNLKQEELKRVLKFTLTDFSKFSIARFESETQQICWCG